MKPEYINPNNIAILIALATLIFCKSPKSKIIWVLIVGLARPLISSGMINSVEWHLILTEPQLQGKLLYGIIVVVFIVASIQMWKQNGAVIFFKRKTN